MVRSNAVVLAAADTVPRDPVLERFQADSLAEPARRPAAWDSQPALIAADAAFKTFVRPGKPAPGLGCP